MKQNEHDKQFLFSKEFKKLIEVCNFSIPNVIADIRYFCTCIILYRIYRKWYKENKSFIYELFVCLIQYNSGVPISHICPLFWGSRVAFDAWGGE